LVIVTKKLKSIGAILVRVEGFLALCKSSQGSNLLQFSKEARCWWY